MATETLLTAVISSRQLQLLLRCISFSKKAQVRITADGMRFSTSEGSALEAFVFLEKALFTTYTFNAPPHHHLSDDEAVSSIFDISLTALLETLAIFTITDPTVSKRPGGDGYDSFAAHRLHRHAGIGAFANATIGVSGICSIAYEGEGSPLSIHMSEGGVTTTCDLTTYAADTTEEIPFSRDAIALKTIMRSVNLLDTVAELSNLNSSELTIIANPRPSRATGTNLSFSAVGTLGSANVDFTTNTQSETPILETFLCPERTEASFKFSLVKAAQRAMASATKVSLRLDDEGVLSMQFLIELEPPSSMSGSLGGSDGQVAFVDFRVVPLMDEEQADGRVNVGADDAESDDD